MPLTDQAILDYIAAHPDARREDVRRNVASEVSPPTVWRALKRLVEEGRLEVSGKARATGYSLAGAAVVRAHLQTPYNRRRLAVYKKEFVDLYIPNRSFYLGETDRQRLHEVGRPVPPPLPGRFGENDGIDGGDVVVEAVLVVAQGGALGDLRGVALGRAAGVVEIPVDMRGFDHQRVVFPPTD